MLHAPTYRTVEGAYLDLLRLACDSPEFNIAARGNDAREVIGVTFRLPNPRQRLPYIAARKANPVFQFAEALWYLAGRRDLEMIGYYAPSMRSSSKDGVTLGGSAYGHTLFNPPAVGDTWSPFERVLELLRTETDSKRGYLPVFSAAELAVADNPDMACLAGLHLFVRDGPPAHGVQHAGQRSGLRPAVRRVLVHGDPGVRRDPTRPGAGPLHPHHRLGARE